MRCRSYRSHSAALARVLPALAYGDNYSPEEHGPFCASPTKGPHMRTINSHVVNPTNDAIKIAVLDEPGAGGANHTYAVEWPAKESGPGHRDPATGEWHDVCLIRFQNGPIAEEGLNGVTQEALLAIVIDRLQSFQKGPFACRENALALTKVEEAMHWLQHRTLDRMRRGVEGTNQK
jgi:hypothetical protein